MATKKHKLKIWPEHFRAVKKLTKLYEVRYNDRDYRVGDILQLQEWHPKREEYTGDEVERKVGHILDLEEFGLGQRYVVLGFNFKHLTKQERPTKANLEKRKQAFGLKLKPFVEEEGGKYPRWMVNQFFEWWSEHGDNDHKMRFEKRESFDTSRRLATWYRKAKERGEMGKELGTFKK